MQACWAWNPNKLMWFTQEEKIDSKKPLNPKLVKYSAKEFISTIPEMFKKFNLNGITDCRVITQVCKEPIRVFSIFNKIGTSNDWGHKADPSDRKSTPFQIIEVGLCRRSMLNLTDASQSEEQNKNVREIMHEHSRKDIRIYLCKNNDQIRLFMLNL